MNIEIDDEMLAAADDYSMHLSNGDLSPKGMDEYEAARTKLLAMLMAKIETEKMFQRIKA